MTSVQLTGPVEAALCMHFQKIQCSLLVKSLETEYL